MFARGIESMLPHGYRIKWEKAAYLIIAFMVLSVFLMWILVPPLIERAYNGKSLALINSLIKGQGEYSLNRYFSIFNSLMTVWAATVAWASVVLAHVAYKGRINIHGSMGADQATSSSASSWVGIVSCYSALTLASLFFIIVFHGGTYLSVMTHDTFIFFDGEHRIDLGQVPHRDFHTALGIAAFYIPYLGYVMKSGYAGSLELASFMTAAVMTLFSILLLRGRTSAFFAVLTIVYLAFLVMVPMNPGTDPWDITHAMFYNRWAWAALLLIFVAYIIPESYSVKRLMLDAVLVGLLMGFLFFLKMTYFLFSLVFLVLLAFSSRTQRYLAVVAGGVFVVLWVMIELRFSVTGAYVRDLKSAIEASGAVRGSFVHILADNFNEYLLAIVALVVLAMKSGLRWQDAAYVAFVGAAGVVIISQNFQSRHVAVILPILLWAYAAAAVSKNDRSQDLRVGEALGEGKKIMAILLVLFIAPPAIADMRAILSLSKGIADYESHASVAGLKGVYIDEQISYLDKVYPGADPIKIFNDVRLTETKQPLSQREYAQTVNEGVALLRLSNVMSGRIATFDFANPFNFLTDAAPSKGDYAWFHYGRNISESSYEPARDIFFDVEYIMIPTFPMDYPTTEFLWEVYGGYVQEEYDFLAKNKFWSLYKRKHSHRAGTES